METHIAIVFAVSCSIVGRFGMYGLYGFMVDAMEGCG